jgi:hypothetical protein
LNYDLSRIARLASKFRVRSPERIGRGGCGHWRSCAASKADFVVC